MSDDGYSEEYDEYADDGSSIEFSDGDYDVHSSDDIEHEDARAKIMFTFPTATTSGGVPTHRMKYKNINLDEIQKELTMQVQRLSSMLQLAFGKCLNLLLIYSWNEHKLLDDYMNSTDQGLFLEGYGICSSPFPSHMADLLTTEYDENILCGICYCGPTDDEPMKFFKLAGCDHKFCTDCYTQYLKSTNGVFINCPFADPKCSLKMTVTELEVLSDFTLREQNESIKSNKLASNQSKVLSEDQIREMYNLDSDASMDLNSDVDSDEDLPIPTNETDDAKINEMIYDFHSVMQKKEKEELRKKRNRTLLSRYWFNVCDQYCTTHLKRYKHCPYADCDGVVEFLGFDSEQIANIEEMKDLFLIPIVRCSNKHQFCFGCGQTAHAPCPCKISQLWNKKCQDDSETLNWIQSNTKDCPKCTSVIEKNGGCNHMSCTKCRYEFCWVCLGDWTAHKNNYRCDKYVPKDDSVEEVRASLEKYMFYFNHFNNQRISYEKDRDILSTFESKIKDVQTATGASWIETTFYKECVLALLESRQTLKWSYAFLFYVPTTNGRHLIETAQWQLSNKVEQLSKLFADVSVKNVLSKKNSFLSSKSLMINAQDKFLETCIDFLGDANTLRNFKQKWKV